MALIGNPLTAGNQAYFDYVNEQGGVHGRQIDYVVKDDEVICISDGAEPVSDDDAKKRFAIDGYERTTLRARVVFDGSGRIAGLFFVP